MPSTNNLLALTAILALATVPSTVTAAQKPRRKQNIRKKKQLNNNSSSNNNRKLRRDQINKIDSNNTKKQHQRGGLEEDVAFWTNMVRKTQEMSVPTTPPPTRRPTPAPQPARGTCDVDQPCSAVGETCNDGTTETCCGETFDSFVCTCTAGLTYQCAFTDACLVPDCETDSPTYFPSYTPTVGGTAPPVPVPTNPPVPTPPSGGGFNCPAADFVGCTAVDPDNPTDECQDIGEPCPNAQSGEFCCLDDCPRKYCTAKEGGPVQASASSVVNTTDTFTVLSLDWHMDEIKKALDDTTPNDDDRKK